MRFMAGHLCFVADASDNTFAERRMFSVSLCRVIDAHTSQLVRGGCENIVDFRAHLRRNQRRLQVPPQHARGGTCPALPCIPAHSIPSPTATSMWSATLLACATG